jgi:uncharacterized protein YciI
MLKAAKTSPFVVIFLYAFRRCHYASKHFIASGRQVPRTGGVILAHARSRADVEAIMKDDPFIPSGAANFAIVEFTPSMHAAAFELCLGAT